MPPVIEISVIKTELQKCIVEIKSRSQCTETTVYIELILTNGLVHCIGRG